MIACSSKSAAEQKSYSILPVFEVNAKRAFTASQEQVKLNYSLVSQPILINGISFDSSSNRNQNIVYETQNFLLRKWRSIKLQFHTVKTVSRVSKSVASLLRNPIGAAMNLKSCNCIHYIAVQKSK